MNTNERALATLKKIAELDHGHKSSAIAMNAITAIESAPVASGVDLSTIQRWSKEGHMCHDPNGKWVAFDDLSTITTPAPAPRLVEMTDYEKLTALMEHGTPATRITWMEVAVALGTRGKTLDDLLSERCISNKKEVW